MMYPRNHTLLANISLDRMIKRYDDLRELFDEIEEYEALNEVLSTNFLLPGSIYFVSSYYYLVHIVCNF
jgi:hypothetical protein